MSTEREFRNETGLLSELAEAKADLAAAQTELAKFKAAAKAADSDLCCDNLDEGMGMWCFTRDSINRVESRPPCDCGTCTTWRALRNAQEVA